LRAFEIYVDKVNPALSVLAKQVGDLLTAIAVLFLNAAKKRPLALEAS
jgi:hypothetical protein